MEAQKHVDPVDPDPAPEHWYLQYRIVRTCLSLKGRYQFTFYFKLQITTVGYITALWIGIVLILIRIRIST